MPETSVSDDKVSEYSTCQSNDSAGSSANISDHSDSEPESNPSIESKLVKSDKSAVSEDKPVEPSCKSPLESKPTCHLEKVFECYTPF